MKFLVKEHQKHGLKVVRFQLVMGYRNWFVVGCYLDPDDFSSIERVVGAMEQRPRREAIMVVVYLNTNIVET